MYPRNFCTVMPAVYVCTHGCLCRTLFGVSEKIKINFINWISHLHTVCSTFFPNFSPIGHYQHSHSNNKFSDRVSLCLAAAAHENARKPQNSPRQHHHHVHAMYNALSHISHISARMQKWQNLYFRLYMTLASCMHTHKHMFPSTMMVISIKKALTSANWFFFLSTFSLNLFYSNTSRHKRRKIAAWNEHRHV